MKLILSRVVPSDLDALVPVAFDAFATNGGWTALYGVKNAENIANAKRNFLKDMDTDSSDVWLKITDEDAGGRIVSGSNWKLYPTYVKADFDRKAENVEKLTAQNICHFTEEKQREEACWLLQDFMRRRYGNTREAHVLLNILFTCPTYHRCGAGRVMVEWGNTMADQLMVPCWVEASHTGHHLYTSCGYQDVEKPYNKMETIALPVEYTLMRRPITTTTKDILGRRREENKGSEVVVGMTELRGNEIEA